jgi:hypothetical protein
LLFIQPDKNNSEIYSPYPLKRGLLHSRTALKPDTLAIFINSTISASQTP